MPAVGDDYDNSGTLEDAYNSTLEFAERYPKSAVLAKSSRTVVRQKEL